MDRLEFKTTIEDVIRLFGPEGIIYSQDHSVFIRELIQNAMDSIVIHREKHEPDLVGVITVAVEEGKIIITDNGWGLDRDGVTEHFARPLRGIQRYIEPGARGMESVIGHFGVGFLSVFKVSDYVEIETKRKDCPGVSVNMGLKRIFQKGKTELALQSFINEAKTDIEHGMRICIFLGSADSDTARRSDLISGEDAVLKAMRYYVRHPPADIHIYFKGRRGLTRIEAEPYKGEQMDIARRIRVDGLNGWLAYSMGTENPVLQVCQRGLLVRENFPTLLPDNVGAIVGEIDLERTDLVDLALSRETFIENEKYDKLRSLLGSEVFELDREFRTAVEKKIAMAMSRAQSPYAVGEGSEHATRLLQPYERGIQKNIYYHKICNDVTFFVETSDTNLTLTAILEMLRQMKLTEMYIYEREMKFIQHFTGFDGTDYYAFEQKWAPAVEFLKKKGAVLIRLTKREEGAKISFMTVVRKFFEDAGVTVTELDPGRVVVADEDFPLSFPGLEIKVLDIRGKKEKLFFINKQRYNPIVYLNKSNEQAAQIIETAGKIAGPKKKRLLEVYANLLAGRWDEAARLLRDLILEEPLPEPVIEPVETEDGKKGETPEESEPASEPPAAFKNLMTPPSTGGTHGGMKKHGSQQDDILGKLKKFFDEWKK